MNNRIHTINDFKDYGPCQSQEYYNIRDHQSDRVGFVRKVYGILSILLVVTSLMCVPSLTSPSYKYFVCSHVWLHIICIIVYIVTMLILICSSASREYPKNYILLFFFNISLSYLVSGCVAWAEPSTVLIAVLMTAGMTIGLTIYAFRTKTDFTVLGGFLCICCVCLIMLFIFGFCFQIQWMIVMWCCLGIAIYGLYIIYDTQLIMGGKQHELSLDDYIRGAVFLYIDIVFLFLRLLRFLSMIRGQQ